MLVGIWTISSILSNEGHFCVCLTLRLLLGICEDYKKIIVNTQQELILTPTYNDINAVTNPNDTQKLKFLQYIEQGRYLQIAFRTWELHEYPLLQQTQKHTWAVKATSYN